MSYSIDNTDLSVFGFVPGRAPGSNAALYGCWDMPSRTGKVFHDWKDDQGVEPFLDVEHIRLGGRDLGLYGFIRGTDQEDAIAKLNSMLSLIKSLSDLAPLASDWGTFQVYLKGGYQARYEGNGLISIKLNFREPVLDYSGGNQPPGFVLNNTTGEDQLRQISGIDGESFTSLGLTKLKQQALKMPSMKDGLFTSYELEGYHVNTYKPQEMELTLLVSADTIANFNSHLKGLYNRFKIAGYRYFTIGFDAVARFFVDQGFKVNQVNVTNGKVTGVLRLKVKYETLERIENEVPIDALLHPRGLPFLDNNGQYFRIP